MIKLSKYFLIISLSLPLSFVCNASPITSYTGFFGGLMQLLTGSAAAGWGAGHVGARTTAAVASFQLDRDTAYAQATPLSLAVTSNLSGLALVYNGIKNITESVEETKRPVVVTLAALLGACITGLTTYKTFHHYIEI